MTSMLKFLKRKIKPFKKCTGNPSYSFEVVDSRPSSACNNTTTTNNRLEYNTYIDSNDYTNATCNSQVNQSSKPVKRSFFRFHRRKGQQKHTHSLNTNSSLNNRETTNSLTTTTCHFLPEDDEMGIDTDLPQFDTPTSSLNYHNDEWESQSYSDDMYSDEDCIQDLINHTNHCVNQVNSPGLKSMVTYNTRFANDSNLEMQDEDGLKSIHSYTSLHHQSTPHDDLCDTKNHSKRKSEIDLIASIGFKKSKTFQNNHHLNLEVNKQHQQQHQQQFDSPIYKKLDVRQNRKCRRSNTTFTMAGMRKNKIIEYFNNLEMNKPISKAPSRPKLFNSNREISMCGLNFPHKNIVGQLHQHQEQGQNEEEYSNRSIDNSCGSKTENEKIQDLFFYDESLLSNLNAPNRSNNLTEELLDETTGADMTVDSVNVVLSTFLDSPVSVVSSGSSVKATPVLDKVGESYMKRSFMQKIQKEVTSTNNSVEKFRRSSSMPLGLIEPNLSIQVNNSKINALKGFEDDLNTNIITPKKALNFDHLPDLASNTINTPNSPASYYISSFEVCDDEPKPFMRGQTRNLSKNIKQMFKNVIKVQLDALSNLEKFYEAQLLKVEADRCQNLQANPGNETKINEFFDRQLEMLEERVQTNLENIARDKQCDNKSNQQVKKVAQIISSGQQMCNSIKQSKNFIDLKNNLISNQKSLLPSKICDYSPRTANFKRNLSLPFKQNGVRYNGKPLNEYDFSYDKNKVKAHERCLGATNSLAKIVKLNTDGFSVSANSAFKPYVRKESQLIANNFEAYEEIMEEFKPSAIDIRRNSMFYGDESQDSGLKGRQKNMPMPRLSDSHLLFRIKQEKRMNEKRIVNTYQKHFQSKLRVTNCGHVETEV